MKILVFKEKHGDRYLKASTPEEIQESCLKVLRERFEIADHWGYKPRDVGIGLPMLDDMIDSLPEPYKTLEQNKKKRYKKECSRFKWETQWYEEVKAELASPAGQAYDLLWGRVDYEYEGFEVVEVE